MATRPISRSADPRGRAAGFTLIEMLTVLVVLGAVAALAIPAGRGALPGAQARAAAGAVAAEARLARETALRSGRESWIEVDLAARRFRRAGGDWAALPAGVSLRLETAESERAGVAGGRIRFLPEGGATGGRIALGAGGRDWIVEVDWLDGAVALAERRAGP